MHASASAGLIAVGLAVSGCGAAGSGGGDFEGAEREVAEAVESLQSASRTQDGPREICSELLSRELVERLEAGDSSCTTEIRHAIADADLYELTVTDVTVSGSSATARVESLAAGEGARGTMRLSQQDGNWRLDAISSDAP
jgi:hypothetical protein